MTLRLSLVSLMGILLTFPLFVNAGISLKADSMCLPDAAPDPCVCGPKFVPNKGCSGPPTKFMCECFDTPPGGKVTGKCVNTFDCKGTGTEKGGIGDAKGFMDALKGVMGMLQQAMQSKQQQQQQPQPQPLTGTQGCTAYYQVTAPSADPCAYYVPPTSQSLLTTGVDTSTSNALLDALNSGGQSLSVSEQLLGTIGSGLPQQTQTQTQGTPTGTNAAPVNPNLANQAVNLSGTRGDIVVTDSGATIVAQARDPQANTEVAGFYVSDTFGAKPQGIVAGMCQNRPWAGSIVSYVIPPSFFDSLCAWRGYQVGTPAPPAQPVIQQTTFAPTPTPTTSAPTTVSTVAPQVDIWAVPAKVPLGTRTSVFWNSAGVASCTISSPDGSFNENTLSGGAATVPLSGPTTFTISCLTAGGTPVTDYVTVQLSI